MNHSQIKEKIYELNDTELSVSEREQIKGHLKICPECSNLFDKWNLLQQSFSRVPPLKSSEKFVSSVMDKIEEIAMPAEARQGWRIPEWLLPTAGYAFAIALMVVVVNQTSFAETTKSVLLSDIPSVDQWAFADEPVQSAPLLGLEEELL